MRVLVSGSIAYDAIMVFPGHFKDHILPEQIHLLNVSFVTSEMRREFGGCATNIAYGLKALGLNPIVLGAVGQDFDPYRYRLEKLGLDISNIVVLDDCYTAQCYITTDLDNNQITAFHPGAMMRSSEVHVSDAEDINFGVVSPNSQEAMIQHSKEFAQANIPFMFDPGQGILAFSGQELLECIKLCDYLVANSYEASLIVDRTGMSLEALASLVEAFIVTNGGEGSAIYVKDKTIDIPAISVDNIVDPTGCGDAYRAGLIYGISKKWDWKKIGQLATLMGAIKIESRGPQTYMSKRETINSLFKHHFDAQLD